MIDNLSEKRDLIDDIQTNPNTVEAEKAYQNLLRIANRENEYIGDILNWNENDPSLLQAAILGISPRSVRETEIMDLISSNELTLKKIENSEDYKMEIREIDPLIDILKICNPFKRITELTISNGLSAEDTKSLMQLAPYLRENIVSLTINSLTHTGFPVINANNKNGYEAFKILFEKTWPKLEKLTLIRWGIKAENLNLLPKTIKSLHFKSIATGKEIVKFLDTYNRLINLEDLSLNNCEIEDENIETLSNSPSVANLKKLSLNNNSISTSAIYSLLGSNSKLKNLISIELEGNHLDSKTLVIINNCRGFKDLKSINLNQNYIEEEDIDGEVTIYGEIQTEINGITISLTGQNPAEINPANRETSMSNNLQDESNYDSEDDDYTIHQHTGNEFESLFDSYEDDDEEKEKEYEEYKYEEDYY